MRTSTVALLLGSSVVAPAAAQDDNLSALQGMQRTEGSAFTFVDQAAPAAELLGEIVEHINVPDGFEASLYAVVPDARHMAVGPQGIVIFVGTRKEEVWSSPTATRTGVADEVKGFAPSLTFDIPNGPCFSQGRLPLHRRAQPRPGLPGRRVLLRGPGHARSGVVVKQGELIPAEEESFNHTARVCRIGPDKKLYISLGQPLQRAARGEGRSSTTKSASAASSA